MRSILPLQLTPAQFAETTLARSAHARPARFFRWATSAAVIAQFAALGVLLTASYGHTTVRASWVLGPALVILGTCLLLFTLTRAGTRHVLRRATYSTRPRALVVEDEGLRVRGAAHEFFHGWPDIDRVEDDGATIYLMLDDLHFYALPYVIFESAGERDDFVRHVRSKLSAPAIAARAPIRPKPARGDWKGVARALANDAIRLVLGIRVSPDAMARSWATILALVALGVLVPVLPVLWANGINVEWTWYTVPGALLHVSLILAASICAAYAIGKPAEVSSILCAGLLASVTIDIIGTIFVAAGSGIPNFGRFAAAWHWFPGAWLALALAAYASRLVPRGERRLGAVTACIVLIALPLANVYRDRQLWSAPELPEETGMAGKAARMGAAGEDAFYKQSVLLEQELRGVRPGRKGQVDVFFVGVAGYGEQDVFMREINSVSAMFRERFGADGHIVRLVNNPKTLLDIPIASRTSLAAALKRVAEVMDKDEDVLVLFMTSHGSENHRFSLALWPMQFHELDPATLRAALDEAGIRFRVVVVSACYSGGFVKPLEGPDTLVITASAADKNSFGCSNEADWTYFGKAYFDGALRKTHSFVKAFEMAKPAIRAREAKEKFDASEPQISIGTGIAAKLGELEAQLDGAPGAASPPPTAPAATRAQGDRYDEYVRLMFSAGYVEEIRRACDQNLRSGSPDETVKRRPESFQGMEKSARHWAQVRIAWDRYASELCAMGSDAKLLRSTYASKVREALDEKDVDAALGFMTTPAGRRWLDRDREAVRKQTIELGRVQGDLLNSLYSRFLLEQDKIFEDFRKGR